MKIVSLGRRMELYHCEGRQVRRLAEELARQVGFFEKNVRTDPLAEEEALRFLHMEHLAVQLLKLARRGSRRYWKARG